MNPLIPQKPDEPTPPSWWEQAALRWKRESPPFFKKLSRFGKTLGISAVATFLAIVAIQEASQTQDLLPVEAARIIKTICGYAVLAGLVIVGVAGVTVVNTKGLDKPR